MILVLLQDPLFLVIIRLGEGLVDVYGAGRSGGPFAYKEILYREGREELVVPRREARSLGHDEGGEEKVGSVRMIDWAVYNVIGGRYSLSPSLAPAGNAERPPVPMAESKRWITHSAPSQAVTVTSPS